MASVKDLKEKEFKEAITHDIVVIGFWAPWCHSCHKVMPLLDELHEKMAKVKFYKMNVAENPGVSSRYGVISLPNILIFKKGKVAHQIIGSTTKIKIEEQIKKVM